MEKPFRLTRQCLTEKDVVAACEDLLAVRRWRCFRLQSGRVRTPDGRWLTLGEKGLPDYNVMHEYYPGFLMEVKRPGRQADPHQLQKIHELRIGFGLAICVIDSPRALTVWLNEHERRHSLCR
jgi:hypothetical protein